MVSIGTVLESHCENRLKATALLGRGGDLLEEMTFRQGFEGCSSPSVERHFMKRRTACAKAWVMKYPCPGYLDSGEKSDVAKIQSK